MSYLLDKSAFEQRHQSADAKTRLDHHLLAGELATCEVIALEILYSARSAADYSAMRSTLDALEWLPTTTEALRRALDVQQQLAQRGKHRRPIPDLIIAATAELHDATVLHHDKDFDLIAEITGQPAEWIATPTSR
ncbi:PIN domain-containing protein [Salinifilum ghardaiensis]